MKTTLMILACGTLVACASRPPQPNYVTPAEAQTMSAAELCLGLSVWGPVSANSAANEIQRRGVNCQAHAAGIQELQQRRAAAMGILMQNMNRPAPIYQPPPAQPYQTPTPTRCTSEWIGNTWQTVCR